MKKLTVFILGNKYNIIDTKDVDITYINNFNNIRDYVKSAKSKYITFIREEDMVTDRYLKCIISLLDNNYDYIYVQNKIAYEYVNQPKILTNSKYLKDNKPYYGSYIWNYVLRKNKFVKIMDEKDHLKFNELVDKYFKEGYAIGEVTYYHFPVNKKVKHFPYTDVREINYYKNIIFIADYCNGTFNGYISWLLHIGRTFNDKYDLTILYYDIPAKTLNRFSEFFRCIKYDNSINYVCDRLITTYSTYFYPINIYHLEHNYLFIHGVMNDYNNAIVYKDDIYDYYLGVSKTSKNGAEGYFPTNDIKVLYNPFKLDKDLVLPTLKIVSAQRSSKIKRMDRIEKLASILDKLEIPYTWNVFSDYKENTNRNGLIFRQRVTNPLPYVKDADYFVLLSDSEALSYSTIEALSVGTKVVVSDLDAFSEIGVNDENGIIIKRELFDDDEELIKIVQKMYKEKDKKFKYSYNPSLYEGYKDVFK